MASACFLKVAFLSPISSGGSERASFGRELKATGIDFDDMPEAAKYQCDTDRIARNRLKEEEEIKQQEVQANAQISAGQGTAAASSAVTVRVEEPDDAINNEKSVATSISGQASPFRASNAPTEIGNEDSDSAADTDPGHPTRKQRSLTINTTPDNKLHKPVAQHQAGLDEKPDDPTSAVASSFQTANEEVSPSSTTPHDVPDPEHQDRRRGFRRTWVLVQSRGERQAHELRSPASGHTSEESCKCWTRSEKSGKQALVSEVPPVLGKG